MLDNFILGRDPAHAFRISVKDPLHASEKFGEQWRRLFDNKKAIIPSVQYSDQWKALLQAAQKRVLAVDGHQGGGLDHILRHLSFS